MTIKEKIKISQNSNKLTLHTEGLFYKCYNEDAMVFSENIKPYKVVCKFIKTVNQEVLSIGFPKTELKKGSITIEMIKSAIGGSKAEEQEKQLVFSLTDAELKKNYHEWRNDKLQNSKLADKTNNTVSPAKCEASQRLISQGELIAMIQSYDLANSTPMQGIQFIQELKMLIDTS